MAGLIPLFSAEEQENFLARERVFRDRSNPLDCYDDLELVQRFRFSRLSILKIAELIQGDLNSTDRFHAAHPHLQVCVAILRFGYISTNLWRWSSCESAISLQVHKNCCTWATVNIFKVCYDANYYRKNSH